MYSKWSCVFTFKNKSYAFYGNIVLGSFMTNLLGIVEGGVIMGGPAT